MLGKLATTHQMIFFLDKNCSLTLLPGSIWLNMTITWLLSFKHQSTFCADGLRGLSRLYDASQPPLRHTRYFKRVHHIQYFFSVWSCLVFPLTINPIGLLCYITISILFSICLWQLIFWGIWSWIWTLWIKATFYYCIGIRHSHFFERKLSWPKQILFLKCANRQKKSRLMFEI